MTGEDLAVDTARAASGRRRGQDRVGHRRAEDRRRARIPLLSSKAGRLEKNCDIFESQLFSKLLFSRIFLDEGPVGLSEKRSSIIHNIAFIMQMIDRSSPTP